MKTRNWFKATLAIFSLFSAVALATGTLSLDAVNQKLAAMTASLNDASTAIEIKFTALKVDAAHTLDFGMTSSVVKKGAANTLDLKLNHLEYHFGDGTHPTLTADLSAKMDLVTALGQSSINQFAQNLPEEIQQFSANIISAYGAAAQTDIAVDELIKDSKGDTQSVKGHFNVQIDMDKLPNTMKREDVMVKSAQIQFALTLTSAHLTAQAVLNPENKSYSADQQGLKEVITKILNDDPAIYQSLNSYAQFLKDIAQSLVDQKAQN